MWYTPRYADCFYKKSDTLFVSFLPSPCPGAECAALLPVKRSSQCERLPSWREPAANELNTWTGSAAALQQMGMEWKRKASSQQDSSKSAETCAGSRYYVSENSEREHIQQSM
ncbi:hypothetical protein EYF80_014631 [Liparis tanakae]|uniref:Uncharacterized protein n=1 Tax=Liparis tanakae TaxID=230148 RepID=A0A4Z2IBY5_9TELE|nr:hypothetical protein EYF80_014631 [Liparis tanakae]